MKIPVYVEFEKEIEVEVSVEDMLIAFGELEVWQRDESITRALNMIAAFFNRLRPAQIAALTDAQRSMVAKYLHAAVQRFAVPVETGAHDTDTSQSG